MKATSETEYYELTFYTLSLNDVNFIHQHVVDAYTAQFANAETKPISLIFALVGLYLYVEKEFNGRDVQQFHQLMSNNKQVWPTILPPSYCGDITISQVLQASIGEGRSVLIQKWCKVIWAAYHNNHTVIRSLAAEYNRGFKI
jgi:hypothetical protein